MTAWTEHVRRIGHADYEGRFLSVCPGPDAPEVLVMLYADGKENADYFGPIRLECNSEFMRAIGQALIDCANELEKDK